MNIYSVEEVKKETRLVPLSGSGCPVCGSTLYQRQTVYFSKEGNAIRRECSGIFCLHCRKFCVEVEAEPETPETPETTLCPRPNYF
ncbi:MAG: hypothetical protein ACP5IX_02025 [Patescibacteria group bacterium]